MRWLVAGCALFLFVAVGFSVHRHSDDFGGGQSGGGGAGQSW